MKSDVLINSIISREADIQAKQTELVYLWLEQGKELQATSMSLRELEIVTGISKSRIQRYKAIASDVRIVSHDGTALSRFSQVQLVELTKKNDAEFDAIVAQGEVIKAKKEPTKAENLMRNWSEMLELKEHFKSHEAITTILDMWYSNEEFMTAEVDMKLHGLAIVYSKYPALARPLLTRKQLNEIQLLQLLESNEPLTIIGNLSFMQLLKLGLDDTYMMTWSKVLSVSHRPDFTSSARLAC